MKSPECDLKLRICGHRSTPLGEQASQRTPATRTGRARHLSGASEMDWAKRRKDGEKPRRRNASCACGLNDQEPSSIQTRAIALPIITRNHPAASSGSMGLKYRG